MKRDLATILVGALFLIAGVAIGGSMLGYFDLKLDLAGWWTMFIIVPALISIVNGGVNLGNLIMLAVGAMLLLDQRGILPRGVGWKLILPVILLVVGVQLLVGGSGHGWGTKGRAENCGPDGDSGSAGSATGTHGSEGWKGTTRRESAGPEKKSASVVFGEQNISYGNEEFTGGTYSVFCGSCSVNLTSVRLTGDVVISASVLIGGIELVLPENVTVISHVTPVIGGCDVKYPSSRDPQSPKVIINGTVSLGGITIK